MKDTATYFCLPFSRSRLHLKHSVSSIPQAQALTARRNEIPKSVPAKGVCSPMRAPRSTGSHPLVLVGFLAASFLAAFLGSLSTMKGLDPWFKSLRKPSFNPPSWVFGPVWTVLYAMMAVSAWFAWRAAPVGEGARVVQLFAVQLVFNALWSILFFGLHRLELALLDISALWLTLIACQLYFAHLDTTAGILWAPYMAWVSFAAMLNFSFWSLNR